MENLAECAKDLREVLESCGDSSVESGIIDSGIHGHGSDPDLHKDFTFSFDNGKNNQCSGGIDADQDEGNVSGCGPWDNLNDDGSSPKSKEDKAGSSVGDSGESLGERKGVKKLDGFDAAVSQHKRRKETLQTQKQRRDEILDKIRQLEDSAYSDSEAEDDVDFVQNIRDTSIPSALAEISENPESEEMDTTQSTANRSRRKGHKKHVHGRPRQAPVRVMLSEWLFEKPDDFNELWVGVLCPVGKRCIVMASRGKTKIFSRSNTYLGTYRSQLPGGCKYNYGDSTTNRNRGVTILDCIWSLASETFYVLDILCWNSHSCMTCDTEYRQFFLHSKFSENLELLERKPSNPFPFMPLPYFSAAEMPLIMASSVMFPEEVDGILLIHKEAFYVSEANPLCLWVLLSQVESLLGIYVASDVLARQTKTKNLRSRKRDEGKRSQNKGMEVNE